MILIVLASHVAFSETTPWWSNATTLFLVTAFFASFLALSAVLRENNFPRRLGVFAGIACFWIGALGLTATLGESELSDLRDLIHKHTAPLTYNNVRRENFSEWGMMSYMSGQPTYFSNSYSGLVEAGHKGHWLVFTNQRELDDFWEWVDKSNDKKILSMSASVHIWRRWPRNMTQMREIWSTRSSTENIWDKTTRHFLVLRLENREIRHSGHFKNQHEIKSPEP